MHAAYREASIAASIVAVYDKRRGVELSTSQGLVRLTAQDAAELIDALGGSRAERLPGYAIRYLDGNGLAASERRLKPLRASAAAPLPGKSLVVFDAERGLLSDVFPCADGHAQERARLQEVSATVQAGELWIADRHFCVTAFLTAIARRRAAFLIRHHAGLTVKPLSPIRPVGTCPNGALFEHAVQVTDADGHTWTWRRIVLKLQRPTRNGDHDLIVLTNLAAEIANTTAGLNIAVEAHEWERFVRADLPQLCRRLLDLAQRVNLKKLRKNTRGPKNPPTPRTRFKGKPPVSTAKVLVMN